MSNHRRKRPRRSPRCALCTPHRLGNNKGGTRERTDYEAARRGADSEVA